MLKSLNLGPIGQPVDIAIDKNGGVFVVDMSGGTVKKFVNDIPSSTYIAVNEPCRNYLIKLQQEKAQNQQQLRNQFTLQSERYIYLIYYS